MKSYIKTYLDYFGYSEGDHMPCEIAGCGKKLTDIHHISCKGMGGSKKKDFIENLMGLCRFHHTEFGDKKQWLEYLKERHLKFMNK